MARSVPHPTPSSRISLRGVRGTGRARYRAPRRALAFAFVFLYILNVPMAMASVVSVLGQSPAPSTAPAASAGTKQPIALKGVVDRQVGVTAATVDAQTGVVTAGSGSPV